MIRFDLRNVTIEGPDCAGKTTMYREIHRQTSFKWNIQDRSSLSMLCYARLYERDISSWRKILHEELHGLNNAIIIMLPSLDTIIQRFNDRGDDIQDKESLEKLYLIFSEEADLIRSFPNVIIANENTKPEQIIKWLWAREHVSYDDIATDVDRFVRGTSTLEANQIVIKWTDSHFDTILQESLVYDSEVNYYNETRNKFINKIYDELKGNNEYSRKESLTSRRFIMTQDSCISYFHSQFRNNRVLITAVLRSSNVETIFYKDIHFIADLARYFKIYFCLSEAIEVDFNLTIDSAHIIKETN